MLRSGLALAIVAALGLGGCDPTRLDAFKPKPKPVVLGAGGATSQPPAPTDTDLVLRCDPCRDFPSEPLVDTAGPLEVPNNVAELFAGDESGGTGVGPCLVEPELGSLFPKNWLRPRFRFIPAAGQTLFELRLHSDLEENDLVVYTSATSWFFPPDIWKAIGENLVGQPITVSLRGLTQEPSSARVSLATTGTLTIAPSEAQGTIVYWTTTGGSALKGFSIGEEGVTDVLRPEQTRGPCIGCHSSTPDGSFIALAVSSHPTNGDPAHIELRSGQNTALEPDFVTADAMALLAREQQHLPTFSAAHWREGDRLLVSILNGSIAWTDLQAASQAEGIGWGHLARTLDPNAAATHPVFNRAGTAIAYTSVGLPQTIAVADKTDVYVVPFNDRVGGEALPLLGAATADANEYYPAYSPDDAWLAFTQSSVGRDDSPGAPFPFASATSTYSNPRAELFVVNANGGVPQRLLANDPPACSGRYSPGLTNSWGKWAPEAHTIQGKTYYWLTFSSNRMETTRPQLYVTPVVVDAGGQISTYPALYLWNQPADENNHTPAWDVFDIPAVPVK